jgi:hypothetical protein
MFRELDWKQSPKRAKIRDHWRVLLPALVGAAAAIAVCNTTFPDTLWFEKFWLGAVIGLSVGAILGLIWQTRDAVRRQKTSAWFLISCVFGWGAFALVAIFDMVPDMKSQELERDKVRNLDSVNISRISITRDNKKLPGIESGEALSAFATLTKQAKLYYPSHESCSEDFEITIYLKTGSSLNYRGCVPAKHTDDFTITFQAYSSIREIIVPNGRRWINDCAGAK